ncbi:MAG TPA: MmgE/PrpD family protein [Dehalococcoidia bacterium]|nr:MmgE/PrpD family protein [Dehalococcoidia bacterium]
MKTITQEIAAFAVDTRWEDLPDSIVQEVKKVLIEHIGVSLAALSTDKGKIMVALGRRLGGTPESSILGTADKVSCTNAALVNGELMITLDYQANMSFGHDGTFVVPSALAIAESVGASGKDLILALTVGFEISSRLARAAGWHKITTEDIIRFKGVQPHHKNAHSNYGATAAAGRILKLDGNKMLHALGTAGRHIDMSLSSWGEEGSFTGMTKYVVPGWQNTGAMIAALLAETGYTGDITILDDPKRMGWYPDDITADLGKTWIFNQQLHYKPYPCCGAFHNSMDCFYNVIKQNNLMPGEIERVKIHGRGGMIGRQGTELPSYSEKEKQLENFYAAQFNMPFNFALLAYRIPRGVEWTDLATRKNPDIIKFMDKVTFQADPEFVEQAEREREQDPRIRPAKVTVEARGKTFTSEIKYRIGDTFTEVYWTQENTIEKFKHNAERILTAAKTDRAIQTMFELEELDDVSQLISEITL